MTSKSFFVFFKCNKKNAKYRIFNRNLFQRSLCSLSINPTAIILQSNQLKNSTKPPLLQLKTHPQIKNITITPLLHHPHTTTRPNTTTANTTSTPLLNHFKISIRLKGPITISEYMNIILTHHQHGYYMKKDVFGEKGDFITSPEISQLFGELVGVWFVNEWMNNNSNNNSNKLRLVELGPGRGTLMKDVLRVFSKFPPMASVLSVHLVEVSAHMRLMQARYLCSPQEFERFKVDQQEQQESRNKKQQLPQKKQQLSKQQLFQQHQQLPQQQQPLNVYKTYEGIDITWHDSIHDISKSSSVDATSTLNHISSSQPTQPPPPTTHPPPTTFIIAHEFFDALPIHKFQRVNCVWREVLVDVREGKLHMITSTLDTVAKVLLSNILNNLPATQDHVEISPTSLQTIQHIASLLQCGSEGGNSGSNGGGGNDSNGGCGNGGGGGCALVVDYGHMGEKTDTFRGFSKHNVTDPLSHPGECDVTADVNFRLLKQQVEHMVKVHGPVKQKDFLSRMGIDVRLKVLLSKTQSSKERDDLISGYKMIMKSEGMGDQFKLMALSSSGGGGGSSGGGDSGVDGSSGGGSSSEYIPAGFE